MEILEYARRNAIHIDDFIALSISAHKSPRDRCIGDLLAQLHDEDTLVVTELSRLGRSTGEVINLIDPLLETGIRIVELIGMLGGHAVSGIGPKWLRWVAGLLALLFTLAAAVGLAISDSAATNTPSNVFSGLLFALLMALLVVGIRYGLFGIPSNH